MARLLLLVMFLLGAHGAAAANLQISPVSLFLRGDQAATAIQLRNTGTAPIFGQVRVYTWDQRGSDDVLEAATDVAASPPVVKIAPGEVQLIRLVRLGPPGSAERTYRVLIDEVAPEDEAQAAGVDFRLRYSVPLFLLPARELEPPRLDWRLFRQDGNWMLTVRNQGGTHAQIGAMRFSAADGASHEVSKGLFGYVLSQRTREWRLPLPPQTPLTGEVGIEARINGKAVTVAVRAQQ